MDEILNEYTTPYLPGSFSGKSTFKRELKKRHKNIKNSDLNNILASEDTYTLHRPIKKKFSRNKVIVKGINDTFQADLIDVSKISEFNDNNNFILTCIDVFSKYAWAIPIKRKTTENVLEAFKIIFEDGRIPKRIQTDQGNEFINKVLQKYFKNKRNIKHYILNSEMKASVIERFNRTIKEKMWRYFSYKQTYRYIDTIQDLIKSYNNTYHRSIKTLPSNVSPNNQNEIWKNLYGYSPENIIDTEIKFKFEIGDFVRISKNKTFFEKGYTANWTREIFKIHERIPRIPPVYKIIDIHPNKPEVIKGIFYEPQLQKIIPNKHDIYLVEEVIKKRKNNRTKKEEALIKWAGYPEKFNTWEPIENITKVFNVNLDKNKEKDLKERFEFSV